MNGTSGFLAGRSSTSPSPAYRFLHERQHLFGAGVWHRFRTHDVIAPPSDISTKREKVPDTIFRTTFFRTSKLSLEAQQRDNSG
jgi:hypothetical protein